LLPFRVAAARSLQAESFGTDHPAPTNGAMRPADVERYCALDAAGRALLDAAFQKLGMSARALGLALRVARTVADLAGAKEVKAASSTSPSPIEMCHNPDPSEEQPR